MTVQNLLIVEKNAVKIWKISNYVDGKSQLEEIYNLAVHKNIHSAVHFKEEIIILVEGNLVIRLDEMVSKQQPTGNNQPNFPKKSHKISKIFLV